MTSSRRTFNRSALHVKRPLVDLFSPCETIMIQGALRNKLDSEPSKEQLLKMDPNGAVIVQPSFDDNQYQRSSPVKSPSQVPGHASVTTDNTPSTIEGGRKHTLSHSINQFEPPISHRRVNSRGKAVSIRTRQHHRVDSGGLDMLSAAASVGLGKEEFDAVAYNQHPLSQPPMNDPYRMHLPQMRHGGPHPVMPYAPVSHFAAYPMPNGAPYFAGMPGRPMAPFAYAHGDGHPRMDERRGSVDLVDRSAAEAHHHHYQQQNNQAFAVAVAMGNAEKLRQPTSGAHHRKLSSISLSAIFGPPLFNGNEPQASMHPLKVGHHRATSSSISFLDSMGDVDDSFLRNLQAADADVASELGVSGPAVVRSDSKLAAGGTSKRVRRKCSIENCGNRVVQGGLCITHGAKRKTCKHPGCDKNVKKAGLCSTHGPARKRCDAEGCDKVAVQGGKCISHGAKKRVCIVGNCNKQAILSGMCKKHHDVSTGEGKLEPASALPREIKPKSIRQHTRGLSIFQEISADTVQSILNDGNEEKSEENGGSW